MKISSISNLEINEAEIVYASDIRENVFNYIQSKYSSFNKDSVLSYEELNQLRRMYLSELIRIDIGEYEGLNKDVGKAIENNTFISENIEEDLEINLSTGQKLADKIADFGGSWFFISVFFVFIITWMALNVFVLGSNSYDPYPFILLNLILSCIAAIQAPIIMMSQNRQEQKDRIRAEHDYKINLKAELEVKLLHEKIDHLIINQNKKLLEIQEVQVDYMEDLIKQTTKQNYRNDKS